MKIQCKVENCLGNLLAKGFCGRHYWYNKKHGVPETEYSRELAKRRGTGIINQDGYHVVWKDGKLQRKHRLIMEEQIGRKLTKDEHVHHINGNKTDNSIENLKLLTKYTHRHEHRKIHAKEKSCSKCNQILPLDEFCFRMCNPKVKIKYRLYDSWCKKCNNKSRNAWRQKKKLSII